MGKIVITIDRCKGCLLCVEACPKGLLKQSSCVNNKGFFPVNFVDVDNRESPKCTGCTFCAVVCPDLAITVYR